MNRLAKLEAQLATAIRNRDAAAPPDSGDTAAARLAPRHLKAAHKHTDSRLQRWVKANNRVESLERAIACEKDRIAQAERPHLTRADIVGATLVKTQYGWHTVVRVNTKTVSVETGYSWTDRYRFDEILETRTINPTPLQGAG